MTPTAALIVTASITRSTMVTTTAALSLPTAQCAQCGPHHKDPTTPPDALPGDSHFAARRHPSSNSQSSSRRSSKRPKKKSTPKNGSKERQKSKSENRARKALRTISFILGAFIICWTPYHIAALVAGFCSDDCVNRHFFYFTYFLCYANR